MYSSLLTITGLVSLSRAGVLSRTIPITCGSAISTGTLWYGDATVGSYEGQIGVLEAYGNAELLAKYPNTNVDSVTVEVVPCSSSYLNASSSETSDSIPVKLQLTDGSGDCLALESTGAADVFITKQTCQEQDDESQVAQFWTQDSEYGTLFPTWESEPSERWNLQFNEDDTEEVFANPPTCFEGQTCQDSIHYSFIIQES